MKLQKLLLLTCIVLGFSQFSFSSNIDQSNEMGIEPITENADYSTAIDLKTAKIAKEEKSGFGKLFSWVKKKAVKLLKKVADIGGIGDPVDKWFWYWILGWGAGILLTALVPALVFSGGLSGASLGWLFLLLGSLAWIFGTVSLVVWLIKKFA